MNAPSSRELAAIEVALLQPAGEARARWHMRLGWAIVLAGVGGFMAWAALAPLDKGVPLSGTVTVAGNRKAVQHMTGGTVEAILVKEGDRVKAGDPLVRMNAVQARSNAEAARVQYFAVRAAEARLVAERDGARGIAYPPDLEDARGDPRVAANLGLQQQLFTARRSALRTELAALDENVTGLALQNEGLVASREGKREQLALLKEQLDGLRDLAAEGYLPRNRLLELQRQHAQLVTAIAEDTGNLGRGQRQVSEVRMRRLQRQQEFQKEVRTQLSDARKDAEHLMNRLQALDHELGNVVVRAPADGIVVAMNVFTHGGVVSPGFRMMDIVPSGEALVVDGQLPVHLVDKVGPELPVDLMFTAFNQNLTPRVAGVVTHVSADRMVDEKTGQPYYTLKAQVAPDGVQQLAGLQVRPGMPVDMFVRTGERTLLNYLVKPLVDHARMALKEE